MQEMHSYHVHMRLTNDRRRMLSWTLPAWSEGRGSG